MILALCLVGAAAYDCRFRLPDNSLIDLSPLKTFGEDYEFAGTDGFYYYANICGDSMHSCNTGSHGVASRWDSTRTHCEGTLGRVGMFDGAGLPLEVGYISDAKPEEGVVVTYHNGDSCGEEEAVAEFWFYCDVLVESATLFDAGEISPCIYKFEFTTQFACKNQTHRSATLLWWLFVVFAVCCCLCVWAWAEESDGCCQDTISKLSTKVAQAERETSKRGFYEAV
jgi:hypothetical protein